MISTVIVELATHCEVHEIRYKANGAFDLSGPPLAYCTTRGEANNAVIELQHASIEGRDSHSAGTPIRGDKMKQTAKWKKGIVEWVEDDTAYLSVVFTWDTDEAYTRALFYRSMGLKVRIGGPGVFVGKRAFEGIAQVGGSIPDAVVRHNPDATFASRGCPVGCWFCIVPAMEGKDFTLIDNFTPRPILCDNNLSALPDEFQDHIVRRYMQTEVPLLDANSGFEPQTFSPDVYRRWRTINRGPWRFAFDEVGEREDVQHVLRMLKDEPRNKKRVYVLIGNEPFEACMERISEVIAWGGLPHVQPLIKLNARVKRPWVRYDWDAGTLRAVARWTNRRLWKYTPFDLYDPAAHRKPRTEDQTNLFEEL